MARKTARPGRTLGVFFLGLAIAFGLVALAGTWKPELGLDLQGGTSIRLTPKGQPQRRVPQRGPQDHRPARQRLRCRRGRGHRAGQQVHRGGDPRQEPARPGRHRQAPGPAAVPAGGLLRLRPQPLRRRRGTTDPAGPDRARAPTPAPASPLRPRPRRARPPRRPTRDPVTRPPRPAPPTAPRPTTPTAPTARAPPRRRPTRPSAEPDRRRHGSERCAPDADRRTRHPEPRGRPGRRRPAEVDRRAQPGGDRRLQRVHLPARTAPRSTSTTTRRSRWSPASGTRRPRSPRSTCSPRR